MGLVSRYGDDVAGKVIKYGDNTITFINKFADDGLRLAATYGDEVIENFIKYGDNAVEATFKYGSEAIETIAKYGDDGIRAMMNNIDPALISRLDGLGIKPGDFDRLGIVSSETAEKVAEAIANAKFTRNLLQPMRGFMDDSVSIVASKGLSIDEFNLLRVKSADMLSDTERVAMKAIRDSVASPTNDTLMQKVIPNGDIAKYLDGTYNKVGGYVTKAEDVKQLGNYKDIYESLRLDYPGTVYNPATDDMLGVIRFKTPEASSMIIPYGESMGGSIIDSPPFTGNGFTSATNGQIIPEFKCQNYLNLYDGAELYEVSKDGIEILRAVFDGNLGKFIDIFK